MGLSTPGYVLVLPDFIEKETFLQVSAAITATNIKALLSKIQSCSDFLDQDETVEMQPL